MSSISISDQLDEDWKDLLNEKLLERDGASLDARSLIEF